MQQHHVFSVVFSYPFRVFFLLASGYAVALMLAWLGALFFNLPFSFIVWPASWWHAHEMLYGFVVAAVAGFLLTAIANWTGAPPVSKRFLWVLVLIWGAGRLAMWLSAGVGGVGIGNDGGRWLGIVDLLFLPVLAAYVACTLVRYQNHRNLVVLLALLLLLSGNAFMHYGVITQNAISVGKGIMSGLDSLTLLSVVIAGRITPAFSANWLRQQGRNPSVVLRYGWLDVLSIAAVVAILPLTWFDANKAVLAVAAIAAGLINAVRWVLWRGWHVIAEPLLWILYVAYGLIVVSLLLRGISLYFTIFSASLWQHLLAVGGMSTLILGVMTRVAVGHTGRKLQLRRYAIWIYIAILTAAVLRGVTALGWVPYSEGIITSGIAWVLAFILFLILYWPVLSRPRADGRPG